MMITIWQAMWKPFIVTADFFHAETLGQALVIFGLLGLITLMLIAFAIELFIKPKL